MLITNIFLFLNIYLFIFVALTGFYTRKADVFSFGTTIWEIVYRGTKVPYADILLRDNLRLSSLLPRIYRDKLTPELPQVPLPSPPLPHFFLRLKWNTKNVAYPKFLKKLMIRCWAADPERRPSFEEIVEVLEEGLEALHSDSASFVNANCNTLAPITQKETTVNSYTSITEFSKDNQEALRKRNM